MYTQQSEIKNPGLTINDTVLLNYSITNWPLQFLFKVLDVECRGYLDAFSIHRFTRDVRRMVDFDGKIALLNSRKPYF